MVVLKYCAILVGSGILENTTRGFSMSSISFDHNAPHSKNVWASAGLARIKNVPHISIAWTGENNSTLTVLFYNDDDAILAKLYW
jgi:hypothetical protein